MKTLAEMTPQERATLTQEQLDALLERALPGFYKASDCARWSRLRTKRTWCRKRR